jgi:alpha-L-fucosidase
MKNLLVFIACFLVFTTNAQTYIPTNGNLAARTAFQDRKFGMFIHWGASSVLGDGEWVMENKGIRRDDYKKLQKLFNPINFDAAKWVATAKGAGMKYIVFITRHHDGFSNWDTKFSDWKITNTPYKKDVLKMLAAECKKQGIALGLYYSTLDWSRDDYPYETGRTGQKAGRTQKSNYASYLQFMKNQLSELLTNYGPISCIWLDGHWDQTNPEGSADRSSRIDWKYDELYGLIHKLQPNCMIGNNHHLDPINGEDFQMFEQDLPGQNTAGLNFQSASILPLESCITMNDAWGFRITDHHYKTVNEVIKTLVNAAGRNTNLLLNVGPMPNGEIGKEFTDTLALVGKWTKQFGHTIYGTRGGPMKPEKWGVTTQDAKHVYLHVFEKPDHGVVYVPGNFDLVSSGWLNNGHKLKCKKLQEGIEIDLSELLNFDMDQILQLNIVK